MEEFFRIRPKRPDDLPFIKDSWLHSSQDAEIARFMNRTKFYHEQKLCIRLLLDKPQVELRVAHVPEEIDAILGWAAVEPGCIHYVFVKRSARRLGIARALLAPELSLQVLDYSNRPVCNFTVPIPKSWNYNYFRAFPYTRETSNDKI